jgi:hypothetical protein
MIGKPIKGKSFGGCVRYVVNKKEAVILAAEGVSTQDAASITRDFNLQRLLNPALGNAVGHTVLSWSELDKPQLTNQRMIAIAENYMQQMGITDTQYIIVKHTDRQHPHVHIIFNRVNHNGKTIKDKNDYERNTKICRQLTEAYGLHIAKGKQKVNRERLKGNDQVRYRIFDAIKRSLRSAASWQKLEADLAQKGVTLHFKYKRGTEQVQGVSFEKDGIVFKGSALDRSMSLAGIEKQLRINAAAQQQQEIRPQNSSDTTTHAQEPLSGIETGIRLTQEVLGLLAVLLQPQNEPEPEDLPQWKLRKKTKKKAGVSMR